MADHKDDSLVNIESLILKDEYITASITAYAFHARLSDGAEASALVGAVNVNKA